MCTVTYIPPRQEEGYILTSSRDEKSFRETKPPKWYDHGDTRLCYPKDATAGGTWIAIDNHGRLCCLLNGAFIAHQKQAFHTRSRGQVLLGLISSRNDVEDFFLNEKLSDVEPFTIVTIDQTDGIISDFSEFIWDGNDKHFRKLNNQQTYIWSSVTLYTQEVRQQRRKWFSDFLNANALNMSAEKLLSFHTSRHTDDATNNLLMSRDGELKTVSITQIVQEKDGNRLLYFDLIDKTQTEVLSWKQTNSTVSP